MSSAKINISGREVGLKFGLPAMRQFFEKMIDHKLVNIKSGIESYSDLGIAHILWAGYTNAQLAKDEPIEMTFEQFYDVVEEDVLNGQIREEILTAIKVFEESKSMKFVAKKMQDIGEQEKKSLSNGIESKVSASENSD